MQNLKKIILYLSFYFKKPFFGFIQGHEYLTKNEIKNIRSEIYKKNESLVEEFELEFSKLIGDGKSVSFAAARMGFYSLMKILNIKENDEVILLGANCAVMINAVLRLGVTPVYSDIDPDTYGSSFEEIKNKITNRTKLIVAQHSFGIPCDIEKIKKLAEEKKIFLLEDCALTVSSKYKNLNVGNFGGAAIFSLDHSKPINTLIGGLIYTGDLDLYKKLKEVQKKSPDLKLTKQEAIFKRILIEKEFCNFKNYGKLFFKDLWENFKIKILKTDTAFLTEDISSKDFNFQFYPSKYPSFLAELGLKEIQRWKDTMDKRKRLLNELKILFQNSKFKANILKAYFNPDLEIIPHRFILTGNNLSMYKKKISDFVNTDWFWFNKPIVAANEPLENYGYKKGCCILSEELGYDIINIPCMVTEEEIPILLKSLKKSLA